MEGFPENYYGKTTPGWLASQFRVMQAFESVIASSPRLPVSHIKIDEQFSFFLKKETFCVGVEGVTFCMRSSHKKTIPLFSRSNRKAAIEWREFGPTKLEAFLQDSNI